MSAIYCGAKKVPKGKKQGTMRECVEAGKIMYWGVKKIDSKTLSILGTTKQRMTSGKLSVKIAAVRGKKRKIRGELDYEKDATKKKELQKKLDELQKEDAALFKEYTIAKKWEDDKEAGKIKPKTTPKVASKKATKKASKKKTSKK